jgi:hypothetical protein
MLAKCARVYLREAVEKKTFPFVVFDVRVISDIRIVIELDLWGTRGGEAALSNLADDLEELLDGIVLSDPLFTAAIYTNSDLKWVIDEDKDIKHINLSFTATYQG